jgi:hypothetical protein
LFKNGSVGEIEVGQNGTTKRLEIVLLQATGENNTISDLRLEVFLPEENNTISDLIPGSISRMG